MTSNPFDEIFKTIKPLVDEADRITKFAKDIFGDLPSVPKFADAGETDQSDEEPAARYKAVFNLGLSDALVLDDGSWAVVGIEEDAFDSDLVNVYLDNGEAYTLLRTSLVRVL